MSIHIDNDRFRKLLGSLPGKAISILYDQYYYSLLKIARNLTHDEEVSADIVQDAFVHVWQNHKRLSKHHDKSIQFYLVRIVKNRAISHYKQSIKLKKLDKEMLNHQLLNFNDTVEAKLIKTEVSQEIRTLIESFPKREKQCLMMKMDEQMTNEQIAERLNVSKKAVERSITSANKRFRKYWKKKK